MIYKSSIQNFPIVVLTVSDIFSKEMLYNAGCIESIGGLYVWVRLEPDGQRKSELNTKKETTNFVIFDYPKNYRNSLTDPKIYWAVKKFGHSFQGPSWFFWVDDDEILSRKDWKFVTFLTRLLPKNALYAFPRIWVLFKPLPMRVRSARSSKSLYDWQFRLFHSVGLVAPNQIAIHVPIKREVSRRLSLGVRIIHFGYKKGADALNETLEGYENASPGAKTSKARYYFPTTSVNYKLLKLKNLVKLKGPTRRTVYHFSSWEKTRNLT